MNVGVNGINIYLKWNCPIFPVFTGFSPFFLEHDREPWLPANNLLNCSPAITSCTPGTPADYAREVTTHLSYTFEDAAVRSKAAKLNQKWQYDKKTFFHPHKPGDFVVLDDPAQKQNKLASKWKGPYKILRRKDKDDSPGVIYEITDPRNPQSRVKGGSSQLPKALQGFFTCCFLSSIGASFCE